MNVKTLSLVAALTVASCFGTASTAQAGGLQIYVGPGGVRVGYQPWAGSYYGPSYYAPGYYGPSYYPPRVPYYQPPRYYPSYQPPRYYGPSQYHRPYNPNPYNYPHRGW